MSVGYPDYARLSRSGGVLLYGASNISVPYFTELFQGYVGLWPYVTLTTSLGASSDTARITIAYCSDNTFTTQVAFRRIIRGGAQFGVMQYSNLTEWIQFFYETKSGNPIVFSELALYGTEGWDNQFGLVSMDVPLFTFNGSVPANTVQNQPVQRVQPGPAKLYVNTALATWTINVQYFDYGANAYKILAVFNSAKNGTGGVFDMPMIDAPHQLQLDNQTAAAGSFLVSWISA